MKKIMFAAALTACCLLTGCFEYEDTASTTETTAVTTESTTESTTETTAAAAETTADPEEQPSLGENDLEIIVADPDPEPETEPATESASEVATAAQNDDGAIEFPIIPLD